MPLVQTRVTLPVKPPIPPMLAGLVQALPEADGWLYEPKWDGFRAIVFWDAQDLLIQSRDLKPLGRYFPDLEQGLRSVLPPGCVVDGEIVIAREGGLDFDALQQRIHPAASRIQLLAADTPAAFVAFDLLAVGADDLQPEPLSKRRQRLETLLGDAGEPVHVTPATRDPQLAAEWFDRFEGAGLDGVVAKRLDGSYRPGERAMLKLKHQRTADCVVGGFRWYKDAPGSAVGSLLLGLYDTAGVLHHVGSTSTFKAAERRSLVEFIERYRGPSGFGRGRTPGEPSRWTGNRDMSWEPLRPELVCEVRFDHLQGDRFRHGTTFVRWRPDKPPGDCDYGQVAAIVPFELQEIFGASARAAS